MSRRCTKIHDRYHRVDDAKGNFLGPCRSFTTISGEMPSSTRATVPGGAREVSDNARKPRLGPRAHRVPTGARHLTASAPGTSLATRPPGVRPQPPEERVVENSLNYRAIGIGRHRDGDDRPLESHPGGLVAEPRGGRPPQVPRAGSRRAPATSGCIRVSGASRGSRQAPSERTRAAQRIPAGGRRAPGKDAVAEADSASGHAKRARGSAIGSASLRCRLNAGETSVAS